MFLSLFIWFLSLLFILLSVAFFTLFERNCIGLIHSRQGPNNVSFFGLLQPLIDALNLLSKSPKIYPYSVVSSGYLLSPYLSLGISLYLWITVPLFYTGLSSSYSLLAFMLITSLIVFPVLLGGWSSNSKYSLIGCLRSIAQSISYESVFSTILILVFILFTTFSVSSVSSFNFLGILLLLPLWVFCVLAECHRAPFDFSESESELVSGFNTEYLGGLFAFIFLSEYSSLLVSCCIISWLFLSPLVFNIFFFTVSVILLSLLFISIRVTFCRFRYDKLITFAWKSLLPCSLLLLLLSLILLFS